jgi:hypothetical protein
MKMLNPLASLREINRRISDRRNTTRKCRRLHRQTLLQIGRLEYRVLDRGSAMLGSNRQPNRREWTRTAIGANAGVNRNTHVASCRHLDLTFDRIVALQIELLFGLGAKVGRDRIKG